MKKQENAAFVIDKFEFILFNHLDRMSKMSSNLETVEVVNNYTSQMIFLESIVSAYTEDNPNDWYKNDDRIKEIEDKIKEHSDPNQIKQDGENHQSLMDSFNLKIQHIKMSIIIKKAIDLGIIPGFESPRVKIGERSK